MAVDAVACRPLGHLLNGISDLSGMTDVDDLSESAILLVRDCIGLKRVLFFVRELSPRTPRLGGCWSVDAAGVVTDVRHLRHEYSAAEHAALLHLHQTSRLWKHDTSSALESAPWLRRSGIGWSWVVVTPLIAGQELLGVFYNGGDGNTFLDEAKQVELSVLGGSLGMQLLPLWRRLDWLCPGPPGRRRAVVERVRAAINETPGLRGRVLPGQLGMSASHLARTFKREVGVSLVEYRHRVQLGRFFAVLSRGGTTLRDAATEAGFGHYAQFHRVYRKLMGAAPYESLAGSASPSMSERALPAPEARIGL